MTSALGFNAFRFHCVRAMDFSDSSVILLAASMVVKSFTDLFSLTKVELEPVQSHSKSELLGVASFGLNHKTTSMHFSRMRTARLLTVSHSMGGVCQEGCVS